MLVFSNITIVIRKLETFAFVGGAKASAEFVVFKTKHKVSDCIGLVWQFIIGIDEGAICANKQTLTESF